MKNALVLLGVACITYSLFAQEAGVAYKKYEPTIVTPQQVVVSKRETVVPSFWSSLWQRAREYWAPTEQVRTQTHRPGAQRYFLTNEEKELLNQKQRYIQERLLANPQLSANPIRLKERFVKARPSLTQKLQEKGLLFITPQEIERAQEYNASLKGKVGNAIKFIAEHPGSIIFLKEILKRVAGASLKEWVIPRKIRTSIQNLAQAIGYHDRLYTYFQEDLFPEVTYLEYSTAAEPEEALKRANVFGQSLLGALNELLKHSKRFAPKLNLSAMCRPLAIETEFKNIDEATLALEVALAVYKEWIAAMRSAAPH